MAAEFKDEALGDPIPMAQKDAGGFWLGITAGLACIVVIVGIVFIWLRQNRTRI